MPSDPFLEPRRPRPPPERTLRRGLLVEVLGDGFAGEVTGASATTVTITDRRGRARTFGLDKAFVVDENVVRLVLPVRPRAPQRQPAVTRSGSVAAASPAKVARPSRIWVEGKHDAQLVEKVWGDDLRHVGVVVEQLDGADDLATEVRSFRPATQRRLGVLLDHLVDGSKESRIAATIDSPHVLVTGHPFVDVWTAVKPAVMGMARWPTIPRGEDFKTGMCERLGYDEQWQLWTTLLGKVQRWTDLERPFVGAVEELIDFTTVGGSGDSRA